MLRFTEQRSLSQCHGFLAAVSFEWAAAEWSLPATPVYTCTLPQHHFIAAMCLQALGLGIGLIHVLGILVLQGYIRVHIDPVRHHIRTAILSNGICMFSGASSRLCLHVWAAPAIPALT